MFYSVENHLIKLLTMITRKANLECVDIKAPGNVIRKSKYSFGNYSLPSARKYRKKISLDDNLMVLKDKERKLIDLRRQVFKELEKLFASRLKL